MSVRTGMFPPPSVGPIGAPGMPGPMLPMGGPGTFPVPQGGNPFASMPPMPLAGMPPPMGGMPPSPMPQAPMPQPSGAGLGSVAGSNAPRRRMFGDFLESTLSSGQPRPAPQMARPPQMQQQQRMVAPGTPAMRTPPMQSMMPRPMALGGEVDVFGYEDGGEAISSGGIGPDAYIGPNDGPVFQVVNPGSASGVEIVSKESSNPAQDFLNKFNAVVSQPVSSITGSAFGSGGNLGSGSYTADYVDSSSVNPIDYNQFTDDVGKFSNTGENFSLYGPQVNIPQSVSQYMTGPSGGLTTTNGPDMSSVGGIGALNMPARPVDLDVLNWLGAPTYGSLDRSVQGMEDGGAVPRQTMIGDDPHMLAYINPEEAQLLKDLGGTGEPGPGGIPAYRPSDFAAERTGTGAYSHATDNDDSGPSANDLAEIAAQAARDAEDAAVLNAQKVAAANAEAAASMLSAGIGNVGGTNYNPTSNDDRVTYNKYTDNETSALDDFADQQYNASFDSSDGSVIPGSVAGNLVGAQNTNLGSLYNDNNTINAVVDYNTGANNQNVGNTNVTTLTDSQLANAASDTQGATAAEILMDQQNAAAAEARAQAAAAAAAAQAAAEAEAAKKAASASWFNSLPEPQFTSTFPGSSDSDSDSVSATINAPNSIFDLPPPTGLPPASSDSTSSVTPASGSTDYTKIEGITPAGGTDVGEDYTPTSAELAAQLEDEDLLDLRQSQFDVDMSKPKTLDPFIQIQFEQLDIMRKEAEEKFARDGDQSDYDEAMAAFDKIEGEMQGSPFDNADFSREHEAKWSYMVDADDFDGTILGEGEGGMPRNSGANIRSSDAGLGRGSGFKSIEQLKAEIAAAEGTADEGGYDRLLDKGETGTFSGNKRLTEMTLAEAIAFGTSDAYRNYSRDVLGRGPNELPSTPMGKYQIVGTTLAEIVNNPANGFDPNDLFDAETQEKLGEYIINKKRNYEDVLSGKITQDEFEKGLGQEFEGIAKKEDFSLSGRSVDQTGINQVSDEESAAQELAAKNKAIYDRGLGSDDDPRRGNLSVNAAEAKYLQNLLSTLEFNDEGKLVDKDPNFIEDIFGKLVRNFTLGIVDINDLNKNKVQKVLDAYKETGSFVYDTEGKAIDLKTVEDLEKLENLSAGEGQNPAVVGVRNEDGETVSFGSDIANTSEGPITVDEDIFATIATSGDDDNDTTTTTTTTTEVDTGYTTDDSGNKICNKEGYVYDLVEDKCVPVAEEESTNTSLNIGSGASRSFEDVLKNIQTKPTTIAPISANIKPMAQGGMAGLNRTADNFLRALGG